MSTIADTILTPVLQNFGTVTITAITVFVAHAIAEVTKLWKSGALKAEAESLKQKGLSELDAARKQAESIAVASATAAVKQFIADLQAGNAASALDDAARAGLTVAEQDSEKALQDLVANASTTPVPAYSDAGTTVTPQSVTVTGTVAVVEPAPVVVDPVPAEVVVDPVPAEVVVDPAPVAPVADPAVAATATASAPV